MLTRLTVCFFIAASCTSLAFAQEVQTAPSDPAATVAETVAPPSTVVTKLILPTSDGSRTREYDVTDFAISVARGMSYGVGDPQGEASATLSIAGGVDDVLLNWASQATIDTEQARNLTIRSDDPHSPKLYELEGARVLGLNISGGSMRMVSLQVGLRSLKIDGVPMN